MTAGRASAQRLQRLLADLQPPPVGVRVLHSPQEFAGVPEYHGVSYCDAVRRAGEGQAVRVVPGSFQVCRWAPVVLGLKAPENAFEEHLSPVLPHPSAGLLLAPLSQFPFEPGPEGQPASPPGEARGEPHVVLVRTTPAVLRRMIGQARQACQPGGPPLLWQGHGGRIDRSVVPVFAGGRWTWRHRLAVDANHLFAALARSARWRRFTHRLFRSPLVTALFDALISRTLADMSVCRNSTVIPLLTGQGNVSFFCSGGISWGLNNPDHLTSGWPWQVFWRLAPHLAAKVDGKPCACGAGTGRQDAARDHVEGASWTDE